MKICLRIFSKKNKVKELLKISLVFLCFFSIKIQAESKFDCEGHIFQGTYDLHNPSVHIESIIDRILTISEIHDANNYRICAIERGFNNAKINPREKYIVYDQNYIHNLARSANERHWGVVGVMAHEIGHHVFSPTKQSGFSDAERKLYSQLSLAEKQKSQVDELKADMFAGLVLGYLGASLESSQALMRSLKSPGNDTWSTHPSGPKRVAAVTVGWRDACSKSGSECNNINSHGSNQGKIPTDLPKHHGVSETTGYSKFFTLANSFKGKHVTQYYCKIYANVATQQAKRSQYEQCGYPIDPTKTPAPQWSLKWKPQYDWCKKKASAYATQREAQYREKKLIDCIKK